MKTKSRVFTCSFYEGVLTKLCLYIYLFVPSQMKNIILSTSMDNVIFSTPTNFLRNSFQNLEEIYVFVPYHWQL